MSWCKLTRFYCSPIHQNSIFFCNIFRYRQYILSILYQRSIFFSRIPLIEYPLLLYEDIQWQRQIKGYDVKGLAFSGMKCQFPRISQRVRPIRQQISTRLNGCASEKTVFFTVVSVSTSYITWTRLTPIQGHREGSCNQAYGRHVA